MVGVVRPFLTKLWPTGDGAGDCMSGADSSLRNVTWVTGGAPWWWDPAEAARPQPPTVVERGLSRDSLVAGLSGGSAVALKS